MNRMLELRNHLRTSSELALQGVDPTQLQRQCRAGTLVRVRHGIYLGAEVWHNLDRWDRYRMLVLAVNLSAQRPPLFSHESAALIHSIPILGVPRVVHTQQEGRRSDRSRKDIRRHFTDDYEPAKVRLDGLRATSLNYTLLALATETTFPSAVVALDDSLRRNRTDPVQLRTAAQCLGTAAANHRFGMVLDFGDPASESPGESASRALMALFGIQPPELQKTFRDAQGFVAQTDFYWRERGLIGEFDGLIKYQKPEYMGGRSASQVVVDEKIREDRLRALGFTVVRWVWEDVNKPQRLLSLLVSKGLIAGSPLRWKR
ncbi:type IV toxin-antitoxin system AbiEi family antitoxin domain-containing protein [Arthrobacter sp. Sr33]|uniref:type IV toxin-antitoxin system AbiEi family antitoxin domain-containing protein n=1 Tax=Arthrobacter sp. TB 23 TaxID=494419 RepID=UPI00178C60BE|nr:type IV toxin-antitoxin system AbiEi family antitoxin domain-containing protein [Arthrobacter sp. TB 23]